MSQQYNRREKRARTKKRHKRNHVPQRPIISLRPKYFESVNVESITITKG